METKFEDRLYLPFRQTIGAARLIGIGLDRFDQTDVLRDVPDRPFLGQQACAGFGRIRGAADHRHHFIEVGDRNDQTQQKVRAFPCLGEFELGAPRNHFLAEGDEGLNEIAQVQGFRPPAPDRQHIRRKRGLRRRVPPDLIEHHFGCGIAFQVDHHPHAFTRGFVADVGNAFDPLFFGGIGDLLHQAGFSYLIGDRGENDAFAPFALCAARAFNLVTAAHQDRPAPGGICRTRTMCAKDQRRSGEIGAGDILDQLLRRDRRIVHVSKAGVDHFAKVMWRNIGRHANRDPARAVDQQIGKARRQHRRFLAAAIVVFGEIDGILVEIVEQAVGHPRQPRFGVTHRGRGIGVHRAEIALTVDQRHAHRPWLRHPGERVVDRTVAVRVIVAHHVADDLGAFAVRPSCDKPAFLTGEQDPAVHRLQPVTHIRQRAADDHAHRVVEIARLHLINDVDAVKPAHRHRGGGIDDVAVVAQGLGRFCFW